MMTRTVNIALGIAVAAVMAASGYLFLLKTTDEGPAGVLERDLQKWEDAVDREPSNSLARANLAASYQDLGDLDSAAAEFQKALKLAPDEYTYMFRLGLVYRAAGELDDATVMFGQAAERFPDGEKYAPLFQMAEIRFERGDTPAAKALVERSIEDNGLIWNSHLLLGKILAQEGDMQRARQELEKAASFNPDDQEPREALTKISG